jgi:hypothetical protein
MIADKNGRRTEVLDESGMYVYKMGVKKKGKDDMDLGTVTIREDEEEEEDDADAPF